MKGGTKKDKYRTWHMFCARQNANLNVILFYQASTLRNIKSTDISTLLYLSRCYQNKLSPVVYVSHTQTYENSLTTGESPFFQCFFPKQTHPSIHPNTPRDPRLSLYIRPKPFTGPTSTINILRRGWASVWFVYFSPSHTLLLLLITISCRLGLYGQKNNSRC